MDIRVDKYCARSRVCLRGLRKRVPGYTTVTLMAGAITVACATSPEVDGQLERAAQPIINGTPVTKENVGAVRINIPGSGCSGMTAAVPAPHAHP